MTYQGGFLKLLVPASPKELADRSNWFKKDIAQKLAKEKRVEFGYELKGPLKDIRFAPGAFFGVHLPHDFASLWYYHPEKRKRLLSQIARLSKLKPNYVVMHGVHLYWQPPTHNHILRYFNHSDVKELQKMLRASLKLVRELKKIVPIYIENFPLTQYYQKQGRYLPQTFLYSGIGRLYDLLYLKRNTQAGILIDLEHLIIMLNFLNRQKNYHDIPKEKVEKETAEERHLAKIFGFHLKKYYIPYADKKIKLEEAIKKFKAKFYHLTGSTQDVVFGKSIPTHKPIKVSDKTFRKNLKLILKQQAEVLILETASKNDNPAWKNLRTNETELSFYSLCEILLKEL